MRLYRQLMTIPVGQNVSNPINLGTEKLVGILTVEASDAAIIRFQTLVAGHEDSPIAEQTWVDIFATETAHPEAGLGAGYDPVFFQVNAANGGIADNALLIFPKDTVGHVPPVIRLRNYSVVGAPTNITGVAFTARLVSDPHS